MNTTIIDTDIGKHSVVSSEQWLAERRKLLAREKDLTRLGDQVARERHALPWVRIDKDYRFDTPQGARGLADLFEGRRRLLMQHFMFAPGWDAGCRSCSYMADHVAGMLPHLAARGVGFVAVSRATLAEIEAFRARMGWKFRWASSYRSDFNRDFGVGFSDEEVASGQVHYNYGPWSSPYQELPGVSAFYRDDDDAVYHTYSAYGRGVEAMMGTYRMLDLAPGGRGERDVENKMEWVRHHDRYEEQPTAAACCSDRG